MNVTDRLGRQVATVAITVDGNPLREGITDYGFYRKRVLIRNNSEYKIMIRNFTSHPMLADISIDGVKLSTEEIAIFALQTVHVERFLDTNRKFKFVRYSGSGAENSVSTSDAGRIEVKLRYDNSADHIMPRKPVAIKRRGVCDNDPWRKDWQPGNQPFRYGSQGIGGQMLCSSNAGREYYTDDMDAVDNLGLTVEGSASSQMYTRVDIDDSALRSYATIYFELRLAEEPKPAPTYDWHFCTNCGYPIWGEPWKFCPKCGRKI